MQVVGFLVMENGIYAFGVGMVSESPWLVELGVLLDVFVAVFVMGITIYQIQLTDDQIDAVNAGLQVEAYKVRSRMQFGFKRSKFCEDYLQYYTKG